MILQSFIRRVRLSLQAPVQLSELPASFIGIQERNQWIRENRVSLLFITMFLRFSISFLHLLNHFPTYSTLPYLTIYSFVNFISPSPTDTS